MKFAGKLKTLLSDKSAGGLYLVGENVNAERLEEVSTKRNYAYIFLSGKNITDKESFIHVLAEKMSFPSYFGENWDALEECLRDLDWLNADGYMIVYDQFEVFAEREPQQFEVALDIFQTSVDYWKEIDVPFVILFQGEKRFVQKFNILDL
jgi:RNAse (barnase) inhibitor barstar